MPVNKSNEKTDPTPEFVEPKSEESPDVQVMPKAAASADVVTQDVPVSKTKEAEEPQSYVHLADGTVLRVLDKDIPVGAGTGSPYGFWQRENKVYHVIGVYPVETVVEG